ncbi:STAS domain-containing protein [Yinghuangia soli]|uniref:Anti-sigma factor antagonist n=1 Tax=Yinghuangia soli TaxID=2908204 RepID=A0AA41TZX5_9ACTN|nr:STAS domain-containing protein [Yinghuangia soli]MCF2529258.1 STAS domain-containing protein [Yinghuangia soli]
MPNRQTVPVHLAVFRCDTVTGALLTVQGEIDVDSAPQLRGCMTRCLLDGYSTIDVDLSGVTFCDSSGLHAFLDTSRDAARAGGHLRLHNLSPIVARLLTLTGTGTILLGLPARPTPPKPDADADEPPVGPTEAGQVIVISSASTDPPGPERPSAWRVLGWLRGDPLREALLGNPRASLTSAFASHAQRATSEVTRSWWG